MAQSIAALDLGTSKSIAVVAKKDFAGKLSVLRTEMLPSKSAIRRGRIYNSDEVSGIISKLIRKLNASPETMQIEKIYVGIGGQSLHTQLFKVKRPVETGTVTQLLLDSMEEEATAYTSDFEENLGVVSCEYYADGQMVSIPKGTVASAIEARFQLIVGNPCLKRNLKTVLSNNNEVSVAGYFVSPLATAEAVLTSEEKESGCALIEFGDGVTYISIYKNKALKYLATLPLGGLTITKDIRSLNVSEEEAEALKIEHGSVLLESTDNDAILTTKGELNTLRTIEMKHLNWVIEARVDEIIKNAWSQIQNSGYSQTINAGIVITGGGALLRNLPQYIRNLTEKEVRLADAKAKINYPDNHLSPADSCVIGLALLGKENCLKESVILPKEKERTLFGDEVKKVKTEEKTINKEKVDETPKPPRGSIFGKSWKKIQKTFDKGVSLFEEEEAENNKDDKDDNKNDNTANKQ